MPRERCPCFLRTGKVVQQTSEESAKAGTTNSNRPRRDIGGRREELIIPIFILRQYTAGVSFWKSFLGPDQDLPSRKPALPSYTDLDTRPLSLNSSIACPRPSRDESQVAREPKFSNLRGHSLLNDFLPRKMSASIRQRVSFQARTQSRDLLKSTLHSSAASWPLSHRRDDGPTPRSDVRAPVDQKE